MPKRAIRTNGGAGICNSWSITGSMNNARVAHTATLLPDGQVLVAGGEAANPTVLGTAELYTP
ncbi:MAG: kelch repeat-containing protein [Candidatus Acidiferrales bacterium]